MSFVSFKTGAGSVDPVRPGSAAVAVASTRGVGVVSQKMFSWVSSSSSASWSRSKQSDSPGAPKSS